MRLIANKPCSFGGKQFFVGDGIPEELVADAQMQAKYGVITIANDGEVSGNQSGTSFCHEDAAELEKFRELGVTPQQIKEMDESYAVLAKELGELKMVFGILQITAEEAVKTIADIKSRNVLTLIHASDSRKTIKNAAKEQIDKLSSAKAETNEAAGGNKATDTSIEGS